MPQRCGSDHHTLQLVRDGCVGLFVNVQTRCHGKSASPFFGYEAPSKHKVSSWVWRIPTRAEYIIALF